MDTLMNTQILIIFQLNNYFPDTGALITFKYLPIQ
jgi:hypothetical protein